jgi:hypothetical protein
MNRMLFFGRFELTRAQIEARILLSASICLRRYLPASSLSPCLASNCTHKSCRNLRPYTQSLQLLPMLRRLILSHSQSHNQNLAEMSGKPRSVLRPSPMHYSRRCLADPVSLLLTGSNASWRALSNPTGGFCMMDQRYRLVLTMVR